jgi:hypothetical protein
LLSAEITLLYNVQEYLWVMAASMHMEGRAAKWLQVYKLNQPLGNWSQFTAAVVSTFGSYEYPQAMHDLLHLQQSGSVDEYVEFVELRYSTAMHNPKLDEIFFVQQFVKGLKSEIRGSVLCQVATTVNRAVLLARLHYEVLEKGRGRPRGGGGGAVHRHGGPDKPDQKQIDGGADLFKERQLRDYRRIHGVCFVCGEKYDAGHAAKCKRKGLMQLNTLSVEDLSLELSEEVLQQLDQEDQLGDESCKLSLQAISGTESMQSIRLQALVKDQSFLLLVGTGSSATFINSAFVQQVGLQSISCPAVKVKVANGQELVSNSMVPAIEWWCNGHSFSTNMRILELGSYDAILGFDWLQNYDPMIYHWKHKALGLEFWHKGAKVRLQGVIASTPEKVGELSVLQLTKWLKGNEVWALALVDFVQLLSAPLLLLCSCRNCCLSSGMCLQTPKLYHLLGCLIMLCLCCLEIFRLILSLIGIPHFTKMKSRDRWQNCWLLV